MSFESDLRERFYLLAQAYPGYEDVLTQALFALLTREHVLWYSKPGRAKSEVSDAVFGMFDGAPAFSRQLTKDTMPEAVFGNVIPRLLMEEGREIYNLEGGIVTATFARLEEFFDASDFMLRSMLSVLNERYFETKDMKRVDSPLHTAILTTNYVRESEATEAIIDRIICKAMIPGVTSVVDRMVANQTYLRLNCAKRTLTKLAYDELLALSEYIRRPAADGGITIGSGEQLLQVMLVDTYQQRRLERAGEKYKAANQRLVDEPTQEELGVPDISQRTRGKLFNLARASASLNGRGKVVPQDLRAMGYGLYVVGDDTGDAETWNALCDEFLNLAPKQVESLAKLGDIANEIGRMKTEKGQTTTAQMRIGGDLVERNALGFRRMVDKLSGRDHVVLKLAKQQLDEALTALGKPKAATSFDLLKG